MSDQIDNTPNPPPAGRTRPTPSPATLDATSARQGITTGRLRWILGISIALAVCAMVAAAILS